MNTRRNGWVLLGFMALGAASAQSPEGKQAYDNRCSNCHGTDGNGGEHGPSILARAQAAKSDEIAEFLKVGAPLKGMPAFGGLPGAELAAIGAYVHRLPERRSFNPRVKVAMADGTTLEGFKLGETGSSMQLRMDDGRIRLLRTAGGEKFREVTSQSDWASFNGDPNGNRWSAETEINKGNVSRLAPKWVFAVPNTGPMQGTPIVVGGIMYVPTTNSVFALDAGTGGELWNFRRPPTKGLQGNARSLGNNRALSVIGEKVFTETDDAHLVALNRFTGKLIWETEMADFRQNYNATGSILAVGDLIVAGTAGGEEGVRGFLAAYDQVSGKEVWRFWTVPAPGEKGSETWDGIDIAHGGGTTWLTGSYDAASKTVYWTTGNPGPDFNGDNRKGDNLYTCSIIALDATTGKLKWSFQTTPHDEWDWDAVEPLVLVDSSWEGQPRKLLLQANRNGFLYVLDRTDGKLLLAKPMVKKLTWAKEILPNGKPVMNPNQVPTVEGTEVCPSVVGAANHFATSFSPVTGLFYVNTLEQCAIYTKHRTAPWTAGKDFQGGGARNPAGAKGQKILRAFDIKTGKTAWELPEAGQGESWAGTMTTAGGVVFFGDDGGALSAADASTGKLLWSFPVTASPHTSPMTYVFDHKQYVAMAIGTQVYAFALME